MHCGDGKIDFEYKVDDVLLPLSYPADANDTCIQDIFDMDGVGATIHFQYKYDSGGNKYCELDFKE